MQLFSLWMVDALVLGAAEAIINTTGFSDPNITQSENSTCVSRTIPLNVTANNTRLLLSGPANNFETTKVLIRLTQANSTFVSEISKGNLAVNGLYEIFSVLCVPSNPNGASGPQTIQILTHGITLDHSYWDLAPNFSYVNAALSAGYATFAYDRLVLRILSEMLSLGKLHKFSQVVGVGHSVGAAIVQGVATRYPQVFYALILTAHGSSFDDAIIGTIPTGYKIANTDSSKRFAELPNGYWILGSEKAHQFSFFTYPFFDIVIFESLIANTGTTAFGELWTLTEVYIPAPLFTGPVDIVDGVGDFFFCRGDCTFPEDQAALALSIFYPVASKGSQSFIVPQCGHNINAHFAAGEAFQQMIFFLKTNKIY